MSEHDTEEEKKSVFSIGLINVEQCLCDVYSETWALEEDKVGLRFPFIRLE